MACAGKFMCVGPLAYGLHDGVVNVINPTIKPYSVLTEGGIGIVCSYQAWQLRLY